VLLWRLLRGNCGQMGRLTWHNTIERHEGAMRQSNWRGQGVVSLGHLSELRVRSNDVLPQNRGVNMHEVQQ